MKVVGTDRQKITFEQCLRRHLAAHPLLQAADLIKFCFQAAFGAEHILKDADAAREFFFREFYDTKRSDMALYEELNEQYSRVNFAAWKEKELDPERLFRIFVDSSHAPQPSDATAFTAYLAAASQIIRQTDFIPEWEQTLTLYLREQPHPVHHSKTYRQNYAPAYRVVRTALLPEK